MGNRHALLGAIAGDIIGSRFEFHPIKTEKFDLFAENSQFTDDTVLTIAVANALLTDHDYLGKIYQYGRKYGGRGYGGRFRRWLESSDPQPYNSFGNGSAMRVSPVGWFFDRRDLVLDEARLSACVTHNHPEGIKGAQSVALAIYLTRTGMEKDLIRDEISRQFNYSFNQSLEKIRPEYGFDETCQGSVPQSLMAFFQSDDYENTIRKAISLGGDADTMACIAGAIAEACYPTIPDEIIRETRRRLPEEFLSIIDQFNKKLDEKKLH